MISKLRESYTRQGDVSLDEADSAASKEELCPQKSDE